MLKEAVKFSFRKVCYLPNRYYLNTNQLLKLIKIKRYGVPLRIKFSSRECISVENVELGFQPQKRGRRIREIKLKMDKK